MRFTLVDRITELEAGSAITATKCLSLAEEYLADHFPGFPVEPGVLMVEAMVQASAWLMRYSEDFQYSVVLLKEARAVRFNSFLRPGQTLKVESKVHKQDGRLYTFKAAGTVNGESTVSGRLTLEQFNLAERNSELTATDQELTAQMRGLFGQLWTPESDGPATA